MAYYLVWKTGFTMVAGKDVEVWTEQGPYERLSEAADAAARMFGRLVPDDLKIRDEG